MTRRRPHPPIVLPARRGSVFVMALILFKVVDLAIGLRVTDHEERVGLDLTQHKEAGYTVLS